MAIPRERRVATQVGVYEGLSALRGALPERDEALLLQFVRSLRDAIRHDMIESLEVRDGLTRSTLTRWIEDEVSE